MSIEDLINDVTSQDFAKAQPTFADIMSTKVADALEQEKINVAAQIFNNATDPDSEEEIMGDDEQLELDLGDEDEEDIDDEEELDAGAEEAMEAEDVEVDEEDIEDEE